MQPCLSCHVSGWSFDSILTLRPTLDKCTAVHQVQGIRRHAHVQVAALRKISIAYSMIFVLCLTLAAVVRDSGFGRLDCGCGLRNLRREVIIFELNQNVTFVYLLVVADLHLANQTPGPWYSAA